MRIAYYILREAKAGNCVFHERRFLILFISILIGVGEWLLLNGHARQDSLRFNVEEDESATQICTLDLVHRSFDDNSLDGVQVIRA